MEILEKKREEIDDVYKWDLSCMIKNDEDYNKKINELEELVKKIESYKGRIMESSSALLEFYKLYDKFDRLCDLIAVFSKMNYDVDTMNIDKQAINKRTEKIMENISEKISFIKPEMLSTPYDKVLELINENEELKKYEFDLEKMYRYQKFTLSKEEEDIITKAVNAFGSCEDAFYNLDNVDIKLGFIEDEDGNTVELTNSNYIKYMNSYNRSVRENAFNTLYSYWEKHKNTVTSLLKGQIKENFFISNIRQFNTPLEYSLYSDNIDISVYKNLINTVHNNLDMFYRYMELRKKVLGLDEMHMYDIYVDLIKSNNKEVPFDIGKKIVFDALKPLGDNYLNDLNKAFDEHWVDIYPNLGKKSGAYSFGCYDSYPYLLLNYNNTIDSVSTMAHELGHSMHSYYSNKNQENIYAHYPIFLAEIASTVNEVLVNDYLYKNAETKNEKILYLTEFLDKVRTTIYRQTMFAEFEMIMHDKEKEGIPLIEQEFSDTYYNLNKLYYGDNVVSDDYIRYEWMRIPHFYSSFYVYKYATGLSVALIIASKILNGDNDMKEKYLEFLSSGCSDYPLNILKKLGIDMASSSTLDLAFSMFEDKLKELEDLYK